MASQRVLRSLDDSLFFQGVIERHVGNPRFIERLWLEERICEALADGERPFILITAEPGSGKSAIMARLASRNSAWPRYFIRRDQVSPLGPPGARSFLFQIGLQLAALYPDVFTPERMRVTVEQRIGKFAAGGNLVGADVRELIASPFMTAALTIRQQVDQAGGHVVGLRVEKWIADPRQIAVTDLQALAILDPAGMIAEADPQNTIVVLIDALDELRYQPETDSLLDWLANCPELPPNVRFVITSRPDEDLLRLFRARQADRLREIPLDYETPAMKRRVDADLRAYAVRLGQIPEVAAELAAAGETPEVFESTAVQKAEGNLGYLDALGRAMDQAVSINDGAALRQVLQFAGLPAGLSSLYGFFLHQMKARLGRLSVSVEDPRTGEKRFVSAWSEIDLPMLGALAVAAEPLSVAQIHRLAGIQAVDTDVFAALDRLRQFLDEVNGCYRFYHATLPEFLCDPATGANPDLRDLYQEPVRLHRSITRSYSRVTGGWKNWEAIDGYGWRHLSAHLAAGSRTDQSAGLFEAYEAGFLGAKRNATAGADEMDEDWKIILAAAREAGDFARFFRFGYEISAQYSELAHLQTGRIACIAVRLAIRRNDRAGVRRIASASLLIALPVARADALLALLRELLAGDLGSDVIPELINSLETLLPTLDPGPERDRQWASYVVALRGREDRQLRQRAHQVLAETTELPSRMRLYSVIADLDVKAGALAEAVQTMSVAIAECQAFETPENAVGKLLQLVLGAERSDPADVLAESLSNLLPGATALPENHAAAAIRAVFQQIGRLRHPGVVLNLYSQAIEFLTAAGKIQLGRQLLSQVFDAYLPQARGIELMMLLPSMVAMEDHKRRDQAVRQAERVARDNADPTAWLMSLVPTLADATAKCKEVGPVAIPILAAMERREPPLGDERLFTFLAGLAACWACAGEPVKARRYLERLFCEVPADGFKVPDFPALNRARVGIFSFAWLAASITGDAALMDRTLDWLFIAVPRAVAYIESSRVWAHAIFSLDRTPDARAGERALDRLRIRLIEPDSRYHATALLQLADAWAELGNCRESLRITRYAREEYGGRWPIHLLAWAARLLAEQGDIAGCRQLVEPLLPAVPSIPGLNTQADAVRSLARAIRALARTGVLGAAAAGPMFDCLAESARGIDGGEYSLDAESAVADAAADCGLTFPHDSLAERAKHYLEALQGRSLLPVLSAIAALRKTPESAVKARELYQSVQISLERTHTKGDSDRAALCEQYASVVNLSLQTGFDRPAEKLHLQCSREASLVSDSRLALNARAVMAHVEGWRKQTARAVYWLGQAIASSAGLHETYELQDAVERLCKAWEAISDSDARADLVEPFRSVIRRLPDLYQRDEYQARILVSLWEDRQAFSSLLPHVLTLSGTTLVLKAIHEAERLPEGLAPGILYDFVGGSARQVRPAYAGVALAAAQGAVHHRLFPVEVLSATLRQIESMIQELACRSTVS